MCIRDRGWGHGDAETISKEQAIAWFDLPGVGKSPSRFDLARLESLNGQYIREADNQRLTSLVEPLVSARAGAGLDDAARTVLERAMSGLKQRARTLNELAEGGAFLFEIRPLDLDADAARLLGGNAPSLLAATHAALGALDEWSALTTEATVRSLAEALGVKLGAVAQPLRAALTGRATSPGIFDVLELLGREESLARIADRMIGEQQYGE